MLPELGPRLGRLALELIRERGLTVQLGTSVTDITSDTGTLSDDSIVPTHTVIWTAGVTSPLLVERTQLATTGARLVVDEYLQVKENVWAAGDAAFARDPFGENGRRQ